MLLRKVVKNVIILVSHAQDRKIINVPVVKLIIS